MGRCGILDLPVEILCHVLDYLPDQATVRCSLVCRSWNRALVRRLYRAPFLATTDHYLSLVETILGSPDYGESIRILDLSRVIGTLKTARLPDLMRSCPGMQEFYAPQAAMTPAMMQVLPSLHQLRLVDLACCIERFEMSRLVNAVSTLRHLHTLCYPRCSIGTFYPIKAYPSSLRRLALRGGLRDDFVLSMASPEHPSLNHVTCLEVSFAPSMTATPIIHLVRQKLPSLQKLLIQWPLMRFTHDALDIILTTAPQLRHLSIACDYISPRFFETSHPHLETLELQFSGVGKKHRLLRPQDLIDAVEDISLYPRLKALGISEKLHNLLFGEEEEDLETLRGWSSNRNIHLYRSYDQGEFSPML